MKKETYGLLKRTLKEAFALYPEMMYSCIIRRIVQGASPMINTYLSACIINELTGEMRTSIIIQYVLIAAFVNLVAYILTQSLWQVFFRNAQMMDEKMRLHLSEVSLHKSFKMVEGHRYRELLNRICETNNGGIQRAVHLFSEFVLQSTRVITSLILVIPVFKIVSNIETTNRVLQFVNSPGASVLLLSMIFVLTILSVLNARKAAEELFYAWEGWTEVLNRSNYYMEHYIAQNDAGKDIRVFKQQKLISAELRKAFINPIFLRNKLRINLKRDGVDLILSTFLLGIVYLFVALKMFSGAFGVGSLVLYASLIAEFVKATGQFCINYTQIFMNNKYMRDYFEFEDGIISETDEIIDNCKNEDDATSAYIWRFENVSFRYEGSNEWVLRNVSLKLEKGKCYGLVGRNGSGKSTLIKLLCRLYRPTQGRITLNGRDIEKYDLKEYLELLGVVFQDFKLFAYSLGENISGKENVGKSKAVKALKQVGLGKYANNLDMILYKDLVDNGVEISGGEGQKIAFARALYKNAKLYILDEPTAALDPIAEEDFYTNMHQVIRGETALFISHRLSSCRICDEIYVLRNGVMIERGNHDELMKINGEYAMLWNTQAEQYQNRVGE